VTAGEQWLLDRLHELAHRHAREPISCVFVPRADTAEGAVGCPALTPEQATRLRADYLQRAQHAEQYPAPIKLGADVGSVLPVVVGGELIGELLVVAAGAPFDPLMERHLALLGAAGSPSVLVDAHPDPSIAAEFSPSSGERIALYETLIGAPDLRDFVARLSAWLRAGLVVQSAALEVLEASDARGIKLALNAHHVIHGPDHGHSDVWRIPPVQPTDPDRIVLQVGAGEGGAVAGYFVTDAGERGAAVSRGVLCELRALLGHQLTIRREYERSYAQTSQALVEDLVAGRPGPRITRRAAFLGLDLKHAHRAIALRAVSEDCDPEALAAALRRALQRDHDPDTHTLLGTSDDGVLVAFSPAPGTEGALRLCRLAADAGWEVRAGVGPPVEHPSEYADAVRKARWAAEIARTSRPPRAVVEFSGLSFYGLIHRQEWLTELSRFAEQRLGPLLEEGDEKGAALLTTLVEVLRTPSLTGAAAALYIHHSTLRYRIRRIEDLLGVCLDDPDDRFDLDLAIRVLRMSANSASGSVLLNTFADRSGSGSSPRSDSSQIRH
jgi:hypothetical protein